MRQWSETLNGVRHNHFSSNYIPTRLGGRGHILPPCYCYLGFRLPEELETRNFGGELTAAAQWMGANFAHPTGYMTVARKRPRAGSASASLYTFLQLSNTPCVKLLISGDQVTKDQVATPGQVNCQAPNAGICSRAEINMA